MALRRDVIRGQTVGAQADEAWWHRAWLPCPSTNWLRHHRRLSTTWKPSASTGELKRGGWAATDDVWHVAVTPSWLVEYIKKRCKPAPHSSSSSLSIWDSWCKRQFLTKIAPWQVVVPLPVFLAWALVWPQCFEWCLNSLFLFWTSVWTI